jgi:hypothetical protein
MIFKEFYFDDGGDLFEADVAKLMNAGWQIINIESMGDSKYVYAWCSEKEPIIMFHGACAGCTQQNIHDTEFCMGCQNFACKWDLPNLSNRPPSEADIERKRLQEKVQCTNQM